MSKHKQTSGYIYVATNHSMKNLVKIGFSKNKDIQNRMQSMYLSNVPFEFTCHYAAYVENVSSVEKTLHRLLDAYRVNRKREFFKIDVKNVVAFLKLINSENINNNINQLSKKDTTKTRSTTMKITNGNVKHISENKVLAEVFAENTIFFCGKVFQLHQFINELKRQRYNLDEWLLNDMPLSDLIYEL